MRTLFLLVFLTICALSLSLGCSSPSGVCLGGVSNLTLDPSGSTCKAQCDCNNQLYAGECLNSTCEATKRSPCDVKGELRICKLKKPEGNCTEGLQECQPFGFSQKVWGDCAALSQTADEKKLEYCGDGLDNDCDGKTDKADPDCKDFCLPGDTRPCYEPKDPKDANKQNEGICRAGQQICKDTGTWGSCFGGIYPEPEVCDQKDNNCDGKVDEDCECTQFGSTRSCYSGPTGTDKNAPCKAGTQICRNGFWGPCTGEIRPGNEVCNNKDDDCNGKVDDLIVKNSAGQTENACKCWPPGKTESCYNGPTGTLNKGTCASGLRTCNASGSWGVCNGEIKPSTEQCNLQDDDCDGKIDNDPKGDTNTLTRACYSAKAGCKLDSAGKLTCQTPCKTGTQTCFNGNWGPCTGEQSPQPESCNGKDDDCDGKVDNDLKDNPLCDKQAGPCLGLRTPATQCKSGKWEPCDTSIYDAHFKKNNVQGAYSATETCDNVDNNCDGQVDEHLAGCVSTIAGGTLGNADGKGTNARFNTPYTITLSKRGELYVADYNNHQIRRIDLCGNVTTFAGDGLPGFREGHRLQARFLRPYGVRFAPNGEDLYIVGGNHRVRKIDASGMVKTVLGTGETTRLRLGFNATGPIASFKLSGPKALAFESSNIMYVLHHQGVGYANAVLKIDFLAKTYTKLGEVGYYYGYGQDYDPATKRLLHSNSYSSVQGIYETPLPPTSNSPRRIFSSSAGYQEGQSATTIKTDGPYAIRFSRTNGHLYFADRRNHRIRKVDLSGAAPSSSLVAGGGTAGKEDGPIAKATFNLPAGIALHERDWGGKKTLLGIYVSENANHSIRKINLVDDQIDRTYCVRDWIGSDSIGDRDGVGTAAETFRPQQLVFGPKGMLYFTDGNQRIRKIDPKTAEVTTVAGNKAGYQDGLASQATFNNPAGLAFDKAGNLYIADAGNHRIRKIDPQGNVTTFAGDGTKGHLDGARLKAQFNNPRDLTIDPQGNIYVADASNYSVRRIDTSGTVTTLGKPGESMKVDGKGSTVRFLIPEALASDTQGNIYVADGRRGGGDVSYLRKIDPQGNVTTLFGGSNGYLDGDFSKATLNRARGVAIGPKGNLYLADWNNSLIRKVDLQNKTVTTVGGLYQGQRDPLTGSGGGYQNGLGAARQLKYLTDLTKTADRDEALRYVALFRGPYGVAVAPSGKIYVADTENHRIRVILQR